MGKWISTAIILVGVVGLVAVILWDTAQRLGWTYVLFIFLTVNALFAVIWALDHTFWRNER